MIRAAEQVPQVTCFIKACCLEQPHQYSIPALFRTKVLSVPFFCLLEAGRDKKAHSRSLSSWAATAGPFHHLWDKRECMPGLCTPCSVRVSGLGQGCGELLLFKQHRLDHDAAPNASLQKADQAFLQDICHFTFSLKGHQESYVENIPCKSKGTHDNELIGCLNVTIDSSI